MRRVVFLASALLTLSAAAFAQTQPSAGDRAARAALTERNYMRTLHLLGVGPLRPGMDGMHRDAPNAVNYDEARIRAYTLPALLKMQSGLPVRTAAQWWSKRRLQLASLFDSQVYGRVPSSAPFIDWVLESSEHRSKRGIPVTTSHYVGKTASDPKLAIALDVTLPDRARAPVPMVLELGFREGFHFPRFAPAPTDGPDWTEQAAARGRGYAILLPDTVQPDDGAGLSEGVIGIAARGRPRSADEWGALRAWAWGASRAYDLLSKDAHIDARRVAVEGLSRYGKAALVTIFSRLCRSHVGPVEMNTPHA